ncbi:cytochrome c oxidase subunit 4 [Ruicaihuangia caeni]|uniref:cytochrome-c oxidase n=1 Tax=Ruicaihuangia caeni TaxID=3042517 RepID=A0AAW6T8X2_9MICO|nr:cytochrome c oxidase subunit 4 [Klugiella sp. YN-L-19]MDI2098223.1 cytochrome c oxidase subunit 4 [Klugiella sp. YN-L-19]
MKSNVVIYWTLAVFFLFVATMYTVWAYLYYGYVEWVGVVAVYLLAVLFAFLAFYLGKVYKAQGGELPEDRYDANIDDGDPEMGHFAPWSWWPIALAGGAAIVLLGIAVGAWIVPIGVAIVLVALPGWVYEHYRGNFVH